MNISIMDIVLFKSSPDVLKMENPEKYEYIRQFLSDPKNRLPFFRTAEELDDNINLDEDEKNELDSEFSRFWKKFEEKFSLTDEESTNIFIRAWKLFSSFLYIPSLAPLLVNLFLYWDGFLNKTGIVKNFFSKKYLLGGVYLNTMNYPSYQNTLEYSNIAFFICISIFLLFIHRKKTFTVKKAMYFLPGILPVIGMVFNIYCSLNSETIFPEIISTLYIVIASLMIMKKSE